MTTGRRAVVVPLKSFSNAKERLRVDLTSDAVEGLVRRLARGVIEAAGPLDTYVVTDDREVAAFAKDLGAKILLPAESGLNAAVSYAYETLSTLYDYILFAQGDIQRPAGIHEFPFSADVTLVPDHHQTGTALLGLRTNTSFNFAFGPNSALLHLAEADRLGLSSTTLIESPWRFDLDDVNDFIEPQK